MTQPSQSTEHAPSTRPSKRPGHAPVVLAAVLCLVALAGLFALLGLLMQERPQFVGQGLRETRHVLEQRSPTLVVRKKGDDYAVHTRVHPDRAEVRFEMERREEDRGLRKLRTMGGTLQAEYTLTNPHPESVFVLFSCPRPQDAAGPRDDLQVTGIVVESAVEGVRFDTAEAWLWSGELAAGETQSFTVRYGIPAVMGLRYRVGRGSVEPIHELAVSVAFDELPPMSFTSSEGEASPEGNLVRWERSDFLPPEVFEARITGGESLFGSLRRLMQIGPFAAGLFLIAVVSFLLSRRPIGPLQVFTLGAAYGIYFPLVLYLSVTLPLPWALALSVLVPACLFSSQARTLVGGKTSWMTAIALLAVYQVFPTLAAFSGWNRGLVLLCVGVVTLFVVVELQNRHVRAAVALALVGCLLTPGMHAQGEGDARPHQSQVAVGIADYRVSLRDSFVDVEVSIPIEVLRVGDTPIALSAVPLLLVGVEATDAFRLVTVGSGLGIQAREPGAGRLTLRHRVPLAAADQLLTASVPLVRAPAARIVLDSPRADLVFEGAQAWSTEAVGERFLFELGGVGGGSFVISMPGPQVSGEAGESSPEAEAGRADDMYGIGIASADYLTVLNSDGSVILFATYELAGDASRMFELEIMPGARVLSALVDGTEVKAPRVEGALNSIPIDASRGDAALGAPKTRRVALRMDLGRLELGFLGTLELALPRTLRTIGRLRWAVAFPEGFGARVHASGLDTAPGSAKLDVFGEYGRIVGGHTLIELQKTLAPARPIGCSLQYYQLVPGVTDKLGR